MNTTTPSSTMEGELDCNSIPTDYNIAPAIISAMCFVFGIMYTFFGYRFFKATMFTTGLVLGSSLTYIVCEEEALLPLVGKVGVAVAAGILCGLIALLVAHVGLAMTGLLLGALLGAAAMVILQQVDPPKTKWIPVGTLFGAGLLLALLTLYFRRSLTMVGTAMLGAAMIASAVDYYIEQLRLARYVWDCLKAQTTTPLCWHSWGILGLWPMLFLVGTIIQCRVTGKDSQPEALPVAADRPVPEPRPARPRPAMPQPEVVQGRKQQRANLEKMRVRDRRELQQNRYRHLYQIRRSNGDVISRSYIQDIQNKLSPTLRNITNVTAADNEQTSTHTTMTQLP